MVGKTRPGRDRYLNDAACPTEKVIRDLQSSTESTGLSIDIEQAVVTTSTFDQISEWVGSSAEVISVKLIETMFEKFSFKEHMFSIKRYLLLGQGDSLLGKAMF